MNEKQLLENIIRISFTKTEVNRRLRILREFLENQFFKSKSKNLKNFFINSKYSPEDKEALEKLPPEFYTSFNKNNAYPLLSKIGKALNNIDTLHLYLPAEYSPDTLSNIGLWFKKNVSEATLLEMEINPGLGLGCAISKNGVYNDYSLKYFLNSKRPQILQVLDNYVKN